MSTATTSLIAASGEVINTQDQFEVCFFPTVKEVALIGVDTSATIGV
jgi:hypothetical protein